MPLFKVQLIFRQFFKYVYEVEGQILLLSKFLYMVLNLQETKLEGGY